MIRCSMCKHDHEQKDLVIDEPDEKLCYWCALDKYDEDPQRGVQPSSLKTTEEYLGSDFGNIGPVTAVIKFYDSDGNEVHGAIHAAPLVAEAVRLRVEGVTDANLLDELERRARLNGWRMTVKYDALIDD